MSISSSFPRVSALRFALSVGALVAVLAVLAPSAATAGATSKKCNKESILTRDEVLTGSGAALVPIPKLKATNHNEETGMANFRSTAHALPHARICSGYVSVKPDNGGSKRKIAVKVSADHRTAYIRATTGYTDQLAVHLMVRRT